MSERGQGAYPKTVVLKDGTHLVLRELAAGERSALAPLLARVPAAEADRIDRERATALVVACDDGERAVAALALVRREPGRAALALVLDPAYRGRRLGTWMLLDAVHLAAQLGVTRVEAAARPDDEPFQSALRRLDFVPEPERAPDGAVVLAKTIHAGWTDF